jgi:hypothetical protein
MCNWVLCLEKQFLPYLPAITKNNTANMSTTTLRKKALSFVSEFVFLDIASLPPFTRGVHKFFKTLAKLGSSSELLLAKSGNNWPKMLKR